MIDQGKSNSSQAAILEKIKVEFQKVRDAGRSIYTPELRALACTALGAGIDSKVVAEAGGVCLSSVNKWARGGQKGQFQAKRLNLIATRAKASSVGCNSHTNPATVRFRFISGVEMELPRSELNAELLAMLSAIGGQR